MTHKAKKIGTWSYLHTDPDLAARGHHVQLDLYDRPPADAKPPAVTIRWIDDEGKLQSKEEPFHEPILGASYRCSGCGEPFGQQVKLNRKEWASICAESFLTDMGILHFCQDQYACSRRAAERIPSYQEVLTTKALEELREETDGGNEDGRTLACAYARCKKFFKPLSPTQKYHTDRCKESAAKVRNRAKKATQDAGEPVEIA